MIIVKYRKLNHANDIEEESGTTKSGGKPIHPRKEYKYKRKNIKGFYKRYY